MPSAPDLSGTVALVAGASRSVGRGVALALGEAGATVVVTGRTLKAARRRDAPGSIDETAADVSRAGGRGDAVQADHTRVEDVRALAQTVRQRHGRLDVWVHAVGGAAAAADGRPVWEQPLARWDATVRAGVWSAVLTARFLAPLLAETAGLAALVAGGDRLMDGDGAGRRPAGGVYEEVVAAGLLGLAAGLADDLRPHGATAVTVVPGLVRTERVLAAVGATERRWERAPALAGSESPLDVGRAVAGLAVDPARFVQTGQALRVADLAAVYGVADGA